MSAAETSPVLVIKLCGRFKAVVGSAVAYGDSATTAARTAAAEHFKVPEAEIEIEPETATLRARVKGGGK